MIRRIGLTGGIGSGKSVVSRLLGIWGVPVYIADEQAKRLMAEDRCIREGLVRLFGPEIYSGGFLDRKRLAGIIFRNEAALQQVNALVHPRVKEDFRRWTAVQAGKGHERVGLETAILVESGFVDEVDEVWMVYAPLKLRVERAMKRDGASEEDVLKRIQSQMDDEQKRGWAHRVVFNDGVHSLIQQIENFL